MVPQPAHLEPSELGTKEYWDSLYTTELSNHAADPSDIGTCWFDDSDAESRTIAFLASLADDYDGDGDDDEAAAAAGTITDQPPLSRSSTSFLDLGCGNGSLLFALREDGWRGRMLGVDYSAKSIALAQQIASSRTLEDQDQDQAPPPPPPSSSSSSSSSPPPPIHFLEWDLISSPLPPSPHNPPYDLILDKGTFDAISLSDATTTTTTDQHNHNRRICESYRPRLLQLLRPNGGLFLVTSCNWTEPELRAWFEDHEDRQLKVVARVEYPTFTFGGVKGQTITTLCFRRQ